MNVAFGRVAFIAAICSLCLLLVLHAVRPDLDPALHVVSEYALGPLGWMMTSSFLALGIGCAALTMALALHSSGWRFRAGLGLLAIAAFGLMMAAVFPMDPIAIRPEAATLSGRMHGIASMLGVPTLSAAAVLVSLSLRNDQGWATVTRPMLILAHVTWISLCVMGFCLGILIEKGPDGLGGFMGWANRALMAAYAGWIMIAAAPLACRFQPPRIEK
jgi:hypothetical protein